MTNRMKELMADLRVITKVLLGAIITLAAAMQIDAVEKVVTPILAGHPKVSSTVMALVGIGLLLQNPRVRKVFHLDELGVEQPQDAVNPPKLEGK